jgi:hypothetical protein
MGGTGERVEMLFAPSIQPEAVHSAIQEFDVRQASCFRVDERERLLTVIEVGFGSLDVFNEVATQLLAGAVGQRALPEPAEPPIQRLISLVPQLSPILSRNRSRSGCSTSSNGGCVRQRARSRGKPARAGCRLGAAARARKPRARANRG